MRGRLGELLQKGCKRERMRANLQYREGGPTIFAQVKNGKGMDHIVDLILSAWRSSGAAAACEAAKKK